MHCFGEYDIFGPVNISKSLLGLKPESPTDNCFQIESIEGTGDNV